MKVCLNILHDLCHDGLVRHSACDTCVRIQSPGLVRFSAAARISFRPELAFYLIMLDQKIQYPKEIAVQKAVCRPCSFRINSCKIFKQLLELTVVPGIL